MHYVRIHDSGYTYVTREANHEDRWDRDDTHTDHDITGFEVVCERDWYDLTVEFEPKEQVEYYLLYAIYSTGDSFGHDDGQIEHIGLYRDSRVAQENARRIEAHYALNQERNCLMTGEQIKAFEKGHKGFDPYLVTLVTEEGKEFTMHVPWTGYFESLTYVEVREVQIS